MKRTIAIIVIALAGFTASAQLTGITAIANGGTGTNTLPGIESLLVFSNAVALATNTAGIGSILISPDGTFIRWSTLLHEQPTALFVNNTLVITNAGVATVINSNSVNTATITATTLSGNGASITGIATVYTTNTVYVITSGSFAAVTNILGAGTLTAVPIITSRTP